MRDLWFRAKSEQENDWVYGFQDGLKTVWGKDTDTKVVAETIGQCLNIKDINQHWIFEGDILRDRFGNCAQVEYSAHFLRWELVFFKGAKRLKEVNCPIFDWILPDLHLEVIGNRHDHKEMLMGWEKMT